MVEMQHISAIWEFTLFFFSGIGGLLIGNGLDVFLAIARDLPGHLEAVLGVHGSVLRGQVAHMAVGGEDGVVRAEILVDRLGLGRRFDDDDWQKAFELTLLGFIRSIRAVLPLMRAAGAGRIVNFTSSSTRQAIDNLILSNTFRTGVVGLTKTLARELARDNILINVVGPGKMDTARLRSIETMRAEKLGMTLEDLQNKSAAEIPMGRYGRPEELARLAVFLCSAANTYITGQTVLADGGLVRAY